MTTSITEQPTSPSVDAETLIDRIAQWLHDETEHPDSYPEHTWPETEGDDGRREGGFVRIVPKYVQAQFRDIARRLITQFPALSAPRVEPVADDFAEFPYDDERFNKGVQHVVELFAKTLGIDDWEAGDGSENYDDDLQQTFLNIMEARNIYDPETGLIGFASAAPPSQPDTGVREALATELRQWVEAIRAPNNINLTLGEIALLNGEMMDECMSKAADVLAAGSRKPALDPATVEALAPFISFSNGTMFSRLPDDFVLTAGSRLANRQLTVSDFKKLRALAGKEGA